MMSGTDSDIEDTTQDKLIIPAKSKEKYEITYGKFMDWKVQNSHSEINENMMMDYFKQLSETLKPTSLWAIYSMVKTTLNIKDNIDIQKYEKLKSFLKRSSSGYTPKKSKVFTVADIQRFIEEAPNDKYLLTKVVLILGINGSCRTCELKDLTIDKITDVNHELIVKICDAKSHGNRIFTVGGIFYDVVKEYINIRPPGVRTFFVNYQRGKCTVQNVGINKIAKQPEAIAQFLNLPDPKMYTGHAFRRTGASVLAEAGKNYSLWKSGSGSCLENSFQKQDDLIKNAPHFLSVQTVQSIKEDPDQMSSSTSDVQPHFLSDEISNASIKEERSNADDQMSSTSKIQQVNTNQKYYKMNLNEELNNKCLTDGQRTIYFNNCEFKDCYLSL